MSWNFSLVAKDKDEANAKIDEAVKASSGHCPDAIGEIAKKGVEALPEPMDGYRTISVASYGHFNNGEHPGTSNFNLAIQHVADVADQAA